MFSSLDAWAANHPLEVILLLISAAVFAYFAGTLTAILQKDYKDFKAFQDAKKSEFWDNLPDSKAPSKEKSNQEIWDDFFKNMEAEKLEAKRKAKTMFRGINLEQDSEKLKEALEDWYLEEVNKWTHALSIGSINYRELEAAKCSISEELGSHRTLVSRLENQIKELERKKLEDQRDLQTLREVVARTSSSGIVRELGRVKENQALHRLKEADGNCCLKCERIRPLVPGSQCCGYKFTVRSYKEQIAEVLCCDYEDVTFEDCRKEYLCRNPRDS